MAGKLPKRTVKGRSHFKTEREYLAHLHECSPSRFHRRVAYNMNAEHRKKCKKYAKIFSLNINRLPPPPRPVSFMLYVDDMGPAYKYPLSQMSFMRGVNTCFIRNDQLSSLPLERRGYITFNTLGHALALTKHDRLMFTGMEDTL